MPITPAQCRAARGLVDMDQRMLADGAMVTPGVIIDFEKGMTFSDTFAFDRKIHEPKSSPKKKRRYASSKKRSTKKRTTKK